MTKSELNTVDQINWPLLIVALMEKMVVGQKALGHKCGTTQQSISNWLNGRRIPSSKKGGVITSLCVENGVKTSDYIHTKAELSKIEKKGEFKKLPLKVRRLAIRLSELHPRKRKKILSYLTDMLEVEEARYNG